MENFSSLFALVISISGLIWTIWFNLSKSSHEKTTRTVDMFNLFNSERMNNGRNVAWDLLDDMEADHKNIIDFKSLWDNSDDRIREKFRYLYRVLSFWLTLFELGNEGKLDKKLSVRLFSYEYEWWYWRMKKTINDTPINSHPDVFKPFVEEGISWMPRKNNHEKEPRSRKIRQK